MNCQHCGDDTIYRDGVCGDCRTDSPATPRHAAPVYTRHGLHTTSVAWAKAAAVESGHKVGRR